MLFEGHLKQTNKKGLQMQSLSYSMAESQGFEPWVRSSPHT